MKQQKLRQKRLFASLLFGLSMVLLVTACSSTTPEQPNVTLPAGGSTPGTEAPPATEAPKTTEAPATTAPPTTAEEGEGVDPVVIAAIVGIVLLLVIIGLVLARNRSRSEVTVSTAPIPPPPPVVEGDDDSPVSNDGGGTPSA